ncbi:phage holin family protein [Yoonia litorea]|uniref:Putative Holin-X, holin superfamily III n=1 Tax=Yoonia litorea TaxID=1123755 RepID=A0A1I6N074_9RHOB|nr:phage holin family protein [Yoonia litorea]SFS21251.1 Putative Holin-X, holin superfamily III [Yoonia litorea]
MAKHPINQAPSLLVDTLRHFSALIQGELKLARAEVSNIVSRAGVGIALIAIAMLMALVSLNVLATAAVAYIAANGFSIGLASLMVGAALLIVAVVLALAGKSRLSPEALTPNKTVHSVKKDYESIKEAANV